jgi:hypothetical protein
MRKEFLYVLPLLLALVPPVGAQQPASRSAKVWIDNPAEFEEFLESAEIVSVEDLGSGRNQPKRVTLRQGARTHRAIWKPIQRGRQEWGWESYQAEVAAYQLDRLLDLGMVPPTVVREIDDERGSLQLWVEGCDLFADVRERAPEGDEWNQQLSRMKLFDSLIGNGDRSFTDILVDPMWNIILIDHSQAFQSTEELESAAVVLPERFDRGLVEKMKGLDPMSLDIHFDRLLMRAQVNAISARRDALLSQIDSLVAERGEAQVFY